MEYGEITERYWWNSHSRKIYKNRFKCFGAYGIDKWAFYRMSIINHHLGGERCYDELYGAIWDGGRWLWSEKVLFTKERDLYQHLLEAKIQGRKEVNL